MPEHVTNQQRAAALVRAVRAYDSATTPATAAMQAALDAAEARGQAEVVAKVEALAEELGGWGDTAPSQQQVWLADRLRALSSASPVRACEDCGATGEHETWCINAPTVPDVVTTTS